MEKTIKNQFKENKDETEFMERLGVIPSRVKTLKVDVRTWDSLKSSKKENETFNDVIKGLLMERTKAIGNDNVKAIKYEKKTNFFKHTIRQKGIGIEFEYNDVKSNKSDFTLDIKIKKIFFGKRIFNPSEFFGVDNAHKHFSYLFLHIYLKCVSIVLSKEFVITHNYDYENIIRWRQLYYDYGLSEESFKNDIEEPLRLSEEEKPSAEWISKITSSISHETKWGSIS